MKIGAKNRFNPMTLERRWRLYKLLVAKWPKLSAKWCSFGFAKLLKLSCGNVMITNLVSRPVICLIGLMN